MRRHRKLTLHERKRRRARNERRGRKPSRRPIANDEQAQYYRYGGWAVRVFRDSLSAVRLGGKPVPARPGKFPRQAATLAPLPERHRRRIRAEAAHRDRLEEDQRRRERANDLGIELPNTDVWQPAATGVAS